MRTLGIRLEHVRYLSRADLLALTCVQYEHANLAALWMLLEAALLSPQREESVLTARGLPLRYAHGRVLAQAPSAWLAASRGVLAQRAHELAGMVFELRQYAALLAALQLPLQLVGDDAADAGAGYLLETLLAPSPDNPAPTLFAQEAPGLGVIAVTVAQRGTHMAPRVLAHGYPMEPGALGPLLTLLAGRYGAPADLIALGRILLDAHGRLTAPPHIAR